MDTLQTQNRPLLTASFFCVSLECFCFISLHTFAVRQEITAQMGGQLLKEEEENKQSGQSEGRMQAELRHRDISIGFRH